MRVSEEIDAVECMAVHSVSYLVSTRLIAGLVAIIPLYSLSVLAAVLAAALAAGVALGLLFRS